MSLTQSELESRLLAAANSLRGPVDPADFKAYVFPLLFLKRLSDHWDAEDAEGRQDWPDGVPPEAYWDYHRFDIPEGCHWADLRKKAENIGYELQLILDRIQEANPKTLAGIFGEVAWANKDRLPEHALVRLIDIFNGIPLDPGTVSHDMLGNAYEYLLREFAEASGKKAGEFFTPRAVVRLLTRLLGPRAGESIYDPACGSAGMLIEAVNEVAEAGGDTRTLRLYGQEVNLTTAAIARMNLFMHDIEDFKILRGDTLREPKFKEAGEGLTRFDAVIANPPFSLKNWGSETWANDAYKRAFCGVPPATNADYAWIQHMVASMNPKTGRVGVVMPQGALFRGGEADIRGCLVDRDLVDAVITLPPNLFYSTTIAACVMVLRADKPANRRGHIAFVDGAAAFRKGRNQNFMDEPHIDSLVSAAGAPDTGAAPSRLVPSDEVKAAGYDLSVSRYVAAAEVGRGTVEDTLAQLAAARQAVQDAQAATDARLAAAGYA